MSAWVHYVEGQEPRVPAVRQRLSDLMATLGHLPGFLGADLLCSPDQPGLCLLASRWLGQVPPLEVPAGCRAWSFQVVESYSPPPQA